MKEYQGFPISNFRVGFDEALEPWLLPRDAFPVLQNAHLYRGVVEKILGYTFFAQMSYRRSEAMTGLINGANKVYTITLANPPTTNNTIIQASVNAGMTVKEVFTDNGDGTMTSSAGGTGTINYTTGAISVTFNTAPVDKTIGGIQYNTVFVSYDYAPSMARPIMGIKPYYHLNGDQDILIFDTKRVGRIIVVADDLSTLLDTDYGITELPHETQTLSVAPTPAFDGVATQFTGTVTAPIVPGEFKLELFNGSTATATLLSTITDNGVGLLSGSLLNGAQPNYINYMTGKWVLTFTAAPAATDQLQFSGCIYGDVFSGTFSNFFDVENYRGYAFCTNGVDPPRYYDGSCLMYLNTNLSSKPHTVAPYDISIALHLVVNRERLILFNVTNTTASPSLQPNYAWWSSAGNPLDFTNDENLPAPTSQSIVAFSVINTDVIVRFKNSERIFRYTGDAFSPFRWDGTNLLWRCDAPYSAINYDSWFSSVGEPAIVGSDGVNVKRADEIIPDFTLNQRVEEQQPVLSIDQGSIQQCYGERFDDFKEGWLCYKSYDPDNNPPQPSDSVLAFNYLDATYAVYTFPFSCLGFGRIIAQDVWGNNYDFWGEADYAWESYTDTQGALIDLGGDQNGTVYELGDGNSITDMDGNVIPCLMNIVTKDFNPFVEEGQLARLGYVDFLVSSNDATTFRVQFYKDNQLDADYSTYYQESTLVLTANTQSKIWKRIYVGAVGKSHTLRIYQNAADFTESTPNQFVRIHAIVPYFKAAGRIFQ